MGNAIVELKHKRLIVVLGMHRSGTSAITRGLKVMGVELGDRFLPTMEGVNAKGFWEDLDLNAFDEEILREINSNWYNLAPVGASDVETLRKKGYFLRAVELLRQKVGDTPIFGFKDPRVAKLLPFWKEVFQQGKFDVSYVIALRNPLSVVKSLAKRDGIEAEQSYLLWLGHVITSLLGSADNKRVLVDYDCLMQSPEHELNRIAKLFDLKIAPAELQNFKDAFLDQGLRSSVYDLNDLLLDVTCPPIVREIYNVLLDVATEKVKIDDLRIQKKMEGWSAEFERLRSPFLLVDKLLMGQANATNALVERDGKIANLNQAFSECDSKMASVSKVIGERDSQIAQLYQGIADRDSQIINLYQGITDRDTQVAKLYQGIVDRDSKIVDLYQDISERDNRVVYFNNAIVERDGQIANLNQGLRERDVQIANLNQGLRECDVQIANLNQGLRERDGQNERILHSKSWIITKPFRWFGRVCRGEFKAAIDPFKKAADLSVKAGALQHDGGRYESNSEGSRISAPINPTHPTAVILPVYRGIEMTMRCIQAAMPSVLADPDAKLLAINDASPNEGMQEMLEQLAIQWPDRLLVLKNENNLGFVRTVNRGLAYFSKCDVVLLNSDVIVPKDWLGRLTVEAYSRANVGTVTPFSNNATICSFPYFLQENVQAFSLDVDSIDAVFRHEKLPCIEAPTGVGFCMYIRRACLDKIGYLNEEKFGRGYGEENVLCQRALKSGWLNLISPNMYAFHEGGVSFSSDKQALVDRAMQVLDELHPNYHADVQKFIKDDPVKSARVARYAQLLAAIHIPKVLHVSHSVGGGVKQHIDELVEYFGQRIAHILLAPHGNSGEVSICLGISPHADKLTFNLPAGYAELVELLKAVGISAIHFHHTHGLDQKIFQLPADLGVAYLLTAHDFYWLGANPTLTDETGKYPGFYSDSQHNPLYPLPRGMTVQKWQDLLRSFIEGADCVIFPSNSTRKLFENVYYPTNLVVAPHVEQHLKVDTQPGELTKKTNYTIGVLGAIGREKGADLLEQIAAKAKAAGSNFSFKLIGYAYRPLNLVETTGPYETKDLKGLIQKHELDMVFFTAQWPETYSYTLSYALDSGLPIIAPSVGAFPERLSGRPNTLLFNHLSPVSELLNQLTTFVERASKKGAIKAPVFENDNSKYDFYSSDYISIVSRDLKLSEANDNGRFGFDPAQIISGMQHTNATWGDTLVHILWRLHMNPNLRWLRRVIPHGVTRAVRRSLSSSNSHDIALGSKGKR